MCLTCYSKGEHYECAGTQIAGVLVCELPQSVKKCGAGMQIRVYRELARIVSRLDSYIGVQQVELP